MLDVKDIRKNPDEYKQRLAARGVTAEQIDQLIAADAKRRELLQQSEELKKERNDVSAAIAQAKRNKEDATDAITRMLSVGQQIK